MRFVVPVVLSVILVSILVPVVSDDSSASVTMDQYNITAWEEVSGGVTTTYVDCIFETLDTSGGFVINNCSCGVYSDRACTSAIMVYSGTDGLSYSNYNDSSYCQSVSVIFGITGTLTTVYVKFMSGSQYWIYEVVINEDSTSNVSGSESTSDYELSSVTVDSVSYSGGVFTFYYIWVFTSDVTEYSSWTATIYSDYEGSEVLSTYTMNDGDLGVLTYDGVSCGISVTATCSLSSFYIVLAVNDQSWQSELSFTTADGTELTDGATITVETNEIIERDASSSLIFDSSETLVKVFLVLGVVLLVVFVMFGFGVRR